MTRLVYVSDYDEEMHSYLQDIGFIEWPGSVPVFNVGKFTPLYQPGGKFIHFTAGTLTDARINFVDESAASFFMLKFNKKIRSTNLMGQPTYE